MSPHRNPKRKRGMRLETASSSLTLRVLIPRCLAYASGFDTAVPRLRFGLPYLAFSLILTPFETGSVGCIKLALHHIHFTATTLVPSPTFDWISSPSIKRLLPLKPWPSPFELEYPAVMASSMSAIPGP